MLTKSNSCEERFRIWIAKLGFSVSHNISSLAIKYLSVRHEILCEPASQIGVFIQKLWTFSSKQKIVILYWVDNFSTQIIDVILYLKEVFMWTFYVDVLCLVSKHLAENFMSAFSNVLLCWSEMIKMIIIMWVSKWQL